MFSIKYCDFDEDNTKSQGNTYTVTRTLESIRRNSQLLLLRISSLIDYSLTYMGGVNGGILT